MAAQDESTAVPQQASVAKRLVSLDAFRGLTILGMLIVNNIALDTATPLQLTHAEWNAGVHFADLVFPWFLLIVGVAIPYAARSYQKRGDSAWSFYKKAFGRAVSLVALGCLVDSSINKTLTLGLGVLQIIGLAYLVGALLHRASISAKVIIALGLLVIHWAAIRFLPFGDGQIGIFTQDQNLINHLNVNYLKPYHLSGLVSIVPTSALVLIGSLIGERMRSGLAVGRLAIDLIAGGICLTVAGWLWNLDLPFNKPVWTPSYILYAGGWGSIVLGTLYYAIDVKGWRWPAFPIVVFGMNAIMAYVLSILVKVYILQGWIMHTTDGMRLSIEQGLLHELVLAAGRVAGGWLYTVSYILFWWIVLYILYRRKVFWRV